MKNIKRIQLLSKAEVEALYTRPKFNAQEQRLYFALTQAEREVLTQFRNTKTRIFFILQLGYFKAKQQFFNFSLDDVCHDVQFISNTFYYYSHSSSISFTGRISRDYVLPMILLAIIFISYPFSGTGISSIIKYWLMLTDKSFKSFESFSYFIPNWFYKIPLENHNVAWLLPSFFIMILFMIFDRLMKKKKFYFDIINLLLIIVF
ncbi:DUF4158 domain-containing protein [Xenorhabdus nematophila]|uniref:DUF4158 domain-containing protein n=1 Tax=Xenorhabdus nematophila TaxID=628 RepID=UPI0003275AD0|nr:DUF4158 domain-containing protein [Xenorhabdus nematophila]CCW32065.1 hypothetical protein XNC3_3240002 [Xenorhabdus nematophila F1]CEF31699.1 hypothetical protein XNW1_3950001 [Xenorhabdus nematophila str. Websteri]MBA0017764.1 DUF4158 domain-containing protein [Xenorhabdus nematophila]MCB4426995.1 DUF4158 domain-containing protein [Xenorhabdus nematophila]